MVLPDARNSILRSLTISVGIVVMALAAGAIIMWGVGASPALAYQALFEYALGDWEAVINVVTRAAPLILSGLAVAVAFTAGIYNLGGEGQFFLGAFAAAWAGFTVRGLPSWIHLPLTLALAALAGMGGAFLPAWLKIRLGVNEIISTIMFNFVYVLFTGYLANYPFRDPGRYSGVTFPVAASARLPFLESAHGINAGILFAFLCTILVFWIMKYANLGYRWKIIGLNPRFARYGGLKAGRAQLYAMLVSGALAGLAGGVIITGTQFRFSVFLGSGVGWDGILISLLAQDHPIGVFLAGILFAAVKTGSLGMEQVTKVPSELTAVLLALFILLVAGRRLIALMVSRRQKTIVQEES